MLSVISAYEIFVFKMFHTLAFTNGIGTSSVDFLFGTTPIKKTETYSSKELYIFMREITILTFGA